MRSRADLECRHGGGGGGSMEQSSGSSTHEVLTGSTTHNGVRWPLLVSEIDMCVMRTFCGARCVVILLYFEYKKRISKVLKA